jgi:hypothetical protein
MYVHYLCNLRKYAAEGILRKRAQLQASSLEAAVIVVLFP